VIELPRVVSPLADQVAQERHQVLAVVVAAPVGEDARQALCYQVAGETFDHVGVRVHPLRQCERFGVGDDAVADRALHDA
jgi:hypothetical protein